MNLELDDQPCSGLGSYHFKLEMPALLLCSVEPYIIILGSGRRKVANAEEDN